MLPIFRRYTKGIFGCIENEPLFSFLFSGIFVTCRAQHHIIALWNFRQPYILWRVIFGSFIILWLWVPVVPTVLTTLSWTLALTLVLNKCCDLIVIVTHSSLGSSPSWFNSVSDAHAENANHYLYEHNFCQTKLKHFFNKCQW